MDVTSINCRLIGWRGRVLSSSGGRKRRRKKARKDHLNDDVDNMPPTGETANCLLYSTTHSINETQYSPWHGALNKWQVINSIYLSILRSQSNPFLLPGIYIYLIDSRPVEQWINGLQCPESFVWVQQLFASKGRVSYRVTDHYSKSDFSHV